MNKNYNGPLDDMFDFNNDGDLDFAETGLMFDFLTGYDDDDDDYDDDDSDDYDDGDDYGYDDED